MSVALAGLRGIRVQALRETFRTFRPALRGQGWALAGSLALMVLVTVMELLRPWPVKILFDRVLMPDQGPGGIFGLSRGVTVFAAAASTLAISVLLGTLNVWAILAGARVSKKITVRIRKQVFEHLHLLAFPFHQSSRTGDLLIRLMGDVNAVRDALFTVWVNMLGRALLFAGTTAVMFVLEPWLAVFALVPLPLLALKVGRSSRTLRDVTRKQRRREGDAASFAAETLRQIRLVKAYAGERTATEAFARESRSGERAGLKATRIAAYVERTTEILTGLGLAVVLFVGANWVLSGRITAGELLVFVSYGRSLYKPLRKASNEGTRLSKAMACAQRLLEVLRIPPEDMVAGGPAPSFQGALTIRDVWFRYPGDRRAVQDVSLDVRPGEVAVLSGPNGSGKSTVLALLLRLLQPDEGEILIDGEPVQRYSLESYRQRFAYVPQDIQLFGATVRENILYGRPDASDQDVEDAARLALLHEVVLRLPDGYDTVLGEGGATLSGGEARRVMLARAAVRDARILLLDEPLAGLDPEARSVVAKAIRRMARGRTAVVVSHGPAFEVDADLRVRLEQGRVASTDRGSAEPRATGDGLGVGA